MRDLEEVLRAHFEPAGGSPYWLEVQARLGVSVADAIRSPAEFHRLGPMDPEALRVRPLEDFIPRRMLARKREMVLSETGGTTGPPRRRVFLPEEFARAFVDPWERAADRRGFPRGLNWLWLGPGGPHVIAQAARAMARRRGSLEPFSVDCDPRWVRRQEAGSLGQRLYLDHVLAQALELLASQRIGVIFTTPPLLAALAGRMTPAERRRIRGIHLGGLRVDGATCRRAREEWFPEAVLIPGYGNSLMGVACERRPPAADHEPVYDPDDGSLWIQVAPEGAGGIDLTRSLGPGERGRVVIHRLDRSFLLINWVERDLATVALPPPEAAGAPTAGLRDVGSPEPPTREREAGLY